MVSHTRQSSSSLILPHRLRKKFLRLTQKEPPFHAAWSAGKLIPTEAQAYNDMRVHHGHQLPAELWFHTASFLPLIDEATLAFTSKQMLPSFGYAWRLLGRYEFYDFLLLFDKQLPNKRLCHRCNVFHRRVLATNVVSCKIDKCSQARDWLDRNNVGLFCRAWKPDADNSKGLLPILSNRLQNWSSRSGSWHVCSQCSVYGSRRRYQSPAVAGMASLAGAGQALETWSWHAPREEL